MGGMCGKPRFISGRNWVSCSVTSKRSSWAQVVKNLSPRKQCAHVYMCATARVAVRGQLGGSYSFLCGSLGLNSGRLLLHLSIESFHRLVFEAGLLPGLDSPISYADWTTSTKYFPISVSPGLGFQMQPHRTWWLFIYLFFNKTKLCILFSHSGPRVWGTNTLLTEQPPQPIKSKQASNQTNRETKNHFQSGVGLRCKAKEGCDCWQTWCGLITTEGNPFETCRQTSSVQFTVCCR